MKKSVLRKLLAIFMAVSMMATCIAASLTLVSAEGISIEFASRPAKLRESSTTVDVDILVKGYEKLSTFSFRLKYDNTNLTLKSTANGGIFSGFLSPPIVGLAEPILNFSVGTGDPVSGTNVLATLTFDVTDPKEDEKYEITLIPHDGLSSLQTMVPHPSIAGLNVATNLDYTLVPYELEVVGAEPVSAEFVPPTTKSYVWGTDDALNLAGGKFVVTYDDDSKQDVDLTADMIDTDVTKIFDTIGTYTIEGKYTWGTAEQVATFKFVVSVVAPEKMFGPENLVVDDSGIKKNYVAGAKIDLTGLKVNLLIFAETGCTHDCKDKGEIDEDCTVCVTMELDGSAFRVIEPADGLAYVGMTKFTIALLGDDDVTYVVEGIEVEEEPEGETSTSETGSGTSTTSDTSDTPPGAGDTTMIALWIALALLSMAASVVVVKRRRRLN